MPEIKPGDVVSYDNRPPTRVGFVEDGWVTLLGDVYAYDVPTSTHRLALVRSGTEEDARGAVLDACRMPGTRGEGHKLGARQYALEKGWRELDAEDVTETATMIEVYVGTERIGDVWRYDPSAVRLAGKWGWQHWRTPIKGDVDTKADAIAAVIAAENKRRAGTANG